MLCCSSVVCPVCVDRCWMVIPDVFAYTLESGLACISWVISIKHAEVPLHLCLGTGRHIVYVFPVSLPLFVFSMKFHHQYGYYHCLIRLVKRINTLYCGSFNVYCPAL